MTRLERDARRTLGDFERVVGDISQFGGQKTDAVAARLSNGADAARDRIADFEESAAVRAHSAGRHARTYAKQHPWTAGGIALAAGAIAFGMLAWRRPR